MGPQKPPNLPSSKIIIEKTLGTYETYSSSYLGMSTCIKSKVIAVKYVKYFCSSRLKTSCPVHSFCSTSLSDRISTSLSLENGDQSINSSTLVVSTLSILQLFFLHTLKILHLPFDRGNGKICMSS